MLELKKLGVSALYGLLDLGTEIYDKQQFATALPFQKVTDWQRAIAFTGGLVGSYMGYGFVESASEALLYSSTPLLEKSVYDAVKAYVANTLPARALPMGRGQPGTLVLSRPGGGAAVVTSKTY